MITTRLLLWLGLLLIAFEVLVIALHVGHDSLGVAGGGAEPARHRLDRGGLGADLADPRNRSRRRRVHARDDCSHTLLVAPVRERVVAAKLAGAALAGAALALVSVVFAWGFDGAAALGALGADAPRLGRDAGAGSGTIGGRGDRRSARGRLRPADHAPADRRDRVRARLAARRRAAARRSRACSATRPDMRSRRSSRAGTQSSELLCVRSRARGRAPSYVRGFAGPDARVTDRAPTPHATSKPPEPNTCSRPPARLNWPVHGPGRAGRPRREGAQPQGHRRPSAAACADLRHRPQRLRQVEPRLRHHLRRGPAALRREPERLRAPVPADDGEAGRRLDRRPLARRSRSTRRRRSRNPRSTVGTVTEIYDYLRLLYARIGKPHCPVCGRPIAGQSQEAIVDQILAAPRGHEVHGQRAGRPRPQGRVPGRLRGAPRGRVHAREGRRRAAPARGAADPRQEVQAHDRGRRRPPRDEGRPAPAPRAVGRDGRRARRRPGRRSTCSTARSSPSARTSPAPSTASALPELEPRIFCFNSPHGACPRCTGLGAQQEIDPDLLVPDPTLSIGEGALVPWSLGNSSFYESVIQAIADRYEIDLELPWQELTEEHQNLFLFGTDGDKVYVQYRNRMGRKRAVHARLRGHRREPRAPLPRDRLEPAARADRGVHELPARARSATARGSSPRCSRSPSAARTSTSSRGMSVAARDRVRRRARADRDRAADRRADPEGDPRAADLPRERRRRLPAARPRRLDALRRRGAAAAARDADRQPARRRALHPRRAVDRPAPARQRQADHDARAAARPRQHRARGRARRADDARGRPSRRHGPGRGRARRPRRRRGHGEAGRAEREVGHRPVPLGQARDRDPGAARARISARSASAAPRSTT